jgi:parallel beta-helix repeat protein
MVTLDNVPQAMGRYPNSDAANKGYLTIDSYIGNTQITDSELSGAPNFTGGEVVIRKNRWVTDRNKITNHSGTVINYTSASSYSAGNRHGYFIQGHASTLDKFGEWYYDKAAGMLQMFFGSATPSSYQVKASVQENNVALNKYSYLRFNDLSFQGSNSKAFDAQHTTGITIINSEILSSGGDAVSGFYTTELTVENSVITNAYNNAISLTTHSPNATIRNNRINNTGHVTGMGQSGDQTYQAILSVGDNTIIEGNSVINTGGAALSFRGNNSVCKNNHINTFCYVKDDGGAIHIWNNGTGAVDFTGQKVTDNIITNGVGAPEGTSHTQFYLAKGIYMDDNAANVEVARNTVSKCFNGLYVNNANNINIYGNTFFDNREFQVKFEHNTVAADKPVRNITFKDNVLSTEDKGQELMAMFTKDNDIAQFGTFDNNFYTRTISTDVTAVTTITGQYTSTQVRKSYNLNTWKQVFGYETNSTENKPGPHYRINSLIGANKYPNKTFDSNINGVYNYSPAGNLRTDWDNTNKLDGGSVRASFAWASGVTGVTLVRGDVGAIEANKKYIVRFSILGNIADRTLQISIQNKFVSTQNVVWRSYISTTTRNNYEFLLEPVASISSGVLHFELEEPDGTIWIDNVELYEADVTIDPDHVRMEANTTNSTKTVSLNGITYVNVKGETRSGNLTLAPFASEVLMKQTGSSAATPAPAPAPSSCSGTGNITREYWSNVSGTSVSAIPVNSTPSSTTQLSLFEAPSHVADNYGQRIRGYICAPTTGSYTFYISGDDDSELWLSTDDNPGTKRRIASLVGWTNAREWTRYTSQKSEGISLEAGRRYYVEALHKEGGGGDHLAVAWETPTNSTITVIPGAQLVPFSSSSSAPSSCSGTGNITREYWSNVSGTSVSAIPVNSTPSSTTQLSLFEAPSHVADNYGQRIRGYICAPTTGSYTFYISGDDDSELWLSTDDNPGTKRRIASLVGWTNAREWTRYTSQKSEGISLEAGRRYYVEALHKEGGGGDHLAVAWETPTNSTITVIPGAQLVPFSSSSSAPSSCSGTGNITREYWSNVSGTSVSAIPVNSTPSSTTQLSLFEAPSHVADNYGQRIRGYICAPTTGSYTFYISGDDDSELWLSTDDNPGTKRRIASLVGWTNAREWTRYTSQKSEGISLEAGRRYYVEALHKEGGGGDHLAVAWETPTNSTITVIPGAQLVPFSSSSSAPSSCSGTGNITREYWSNVSGTSVSAIPVNSTPSSTTQLSLFEAPSHVADNYGQRIRGYICAPTTGSYTFYISGDDDSELWLSTDDNPGTKRRIASLVGWTNAREWTRYTSQKSEGISLEAGRRYYVEALHKEGGGGDHLAVAWETPTNSTITVIPGAQLVPFSSSNARLAMGEESLGEEDMTTAYPNPFTDKLNIRTMMRGKVQISVVDALGRLCYEDTQMVQELDIEVDLSQTNLRSGVYFVKLQSEDVSAKIIRVVKK